MITSAIFATTPYAATPIVPDSFKIIILNTKITTPVEISLINEEKPSFIVSPNTFKSNFILRK